jgi:hypothetical protein
MAVERHHPMTRDPAGGEENVMVRFAVHWGVPGVVFGLLLSVLCMSLGKPYDGSWRMWALIGGVVLADKISNAIEKVMP